MTDFKQFDIYWVDLEPTRGSETQKKRPCIIVQSTLLNHRSRTVIVAPILPGHKDWPFAVNVSPSSENGVDKDRHINLKQLRAVDITRIEGKQGELEKSYLQEFKTALNLVFDTQR